MLNDSDNRPQLESLIIGSLTVVLYLRTCFGRLGRVINMDVPCCQGWKYLIEYSVQDRLYIFNCMCLYISEYPQKWEVSGAQCDYISAP